MCLEDELTDHNYAGCQEPQCAGCEDYAAGYRDGKYKGLFDVSGSTADHPTGCDCAPCLAVKEPLRRRAAQQEGRSQNESSFQDSEDDRSGLLVGLRAELALPLGIELTDGDPL